jgi:hypothetical protein
MQQLESNIVINTDFIKKISEIINPTITHHSKVLIVDYENVSYMTKDSSLTGYTLDIQGRYDINITYQDVIKYKIATYFILNYACKNKYSHVFVVCKDPESERIFIDNYNKIKNDGEITLDNQVDNSITTFKCDEIKNWLTSGPKCTFFKINNNDGIFNRIYDAIRTQEPDRDRGRDRPNLIKLKDDFHKLNGSDDSIVFILYSILSNISEKAYIMSEDKRIIDDFLNNQQYIIPFKLNIHNLEDFSHELVINYYSRPITFDHITFNHISRPNFYRNFNDNLIRFKNLLPDYYYGVAEDTVFRNWYKVNKKGKLEIIINLTRKMTDTIKVDKKISYIDINTNRAVLNHRGEPFRTLFGKICYLDDNVDVQYVSWNGRQYVPALKDGFPYRNGDGNIDTISYST